MTCRKVTGEKVAAENEGVTMGHENKYMRLEER